MDLMNSEGPWRKHKAKPFRRQVAFVRKTVTGKGLG
jgi:hypothetical protein